MLLVFKSQTKSDLIQQIKKSGQLAVKYSSSWVYYRTSPARSIWALQKYFASRIDFRFAILYEWNKGGRGKKIAYFDKNKIECYE